MDGGVCAAVHYSSVGFGTFSRFEKLEHGGRSGGHLQCRKAAAAAAAVLATTNGGGNAAAASAVV